MPGLSPTLATPRWLVDLDVQGRVYRYATDAVTVTSAGGQTYRYDSGLAPLSMGTARSLDLRELDIEVHADVDWAKVQGRGAVLEGVPVTVRLQFPGDQLEQCDVFFRGLTDRWVYRKGAPAKIHATDDPSRTALMLPGPQAICTDETWPVRGGYDLSEAANGEPYRIPIGYPGDHPKPGAVADIAEPAYPTPRVEIDAAGSTDERYLVALGRIDAAQTTLYFVDDDQGLVSSDESVAETEDLLGVGVSYVQVGQLAGGDAEFFTGFRKSSGWGGGVLSPYTGNVLRGAGEVLRFLLDYYTSAHLNESAMVAHESWLNRFKIDAVIGLAGNTLVTDWVRDNVLNLLPAVGIDVNGLYYAPLRWDATTEDAVAHLDLDAGSASPEGELRQWDEEVFNTFTIEYRPRYGTDYVSMRTLTSLESTRGSALTGGVKYPPLSTSIPWYASAESDARVSGNALLRASQARFGAREWSQQVPGCWDDTTANLYLYAMAMKHAWPKREWMIRGTHTLYPLLPGDVVTITHAESQLTEAPALIMDRTVSVGDVALDVVLLDSPLTTPILTT